MATTVITKNSSTASAVPVTGDLTQGELAVNVTDKRLFTKNSGGTVVELGTNPASLALPNGTTNGVAYLNGSKVVTTGSALTFDGTNGATTGNWTAGNLLSTAGGYLRVNRSDNATYNEIKYVTSGDLFYFNQANGGAYQFNITGSEQMRLTSTGLGVGTSSPASKLDVSSASNGVVKFTSGKSGWLYADSAGIALSDTADLTKNGLYINNTSNYIALYTGSTGAERMRLDSSGNLGLGTTSPQAYSGFTVLDIRSGTNGGLVQVSDGTTKNTLYTSASTGFVGTQTNHPFGIVTNGTERARIDSSGNLLVGTTSTINSAALTVSKNVTNNNIVVFDNSTGSSPYGLQVRYSGAAPNGTLSEFYAAYDFPGPALRFSVRSNGGIANFSGNNVNISDRQEKTNFSPAKSYLDVICAIPVQTFNYIDQNLEEDDGLTLGVVAQDVQAVAPELVMESNWGTPEEPKMRLSIYQTDLQYALMKALQELKAEFDAYKSTHP